MRYNRWSCILPLAILVLAVLYVFIDRSFKVNVGQAEKLAAAHYSRERTSFRSPDPREWDIAVNVGYRNHVLTHGQVEDFKLHGQHGRLLGSPASVVVRVTRDGKQWEETLEYYQDRCIGFEAVRVNADGNAERFPRVVAHPDDKLDPAIYSPTITSDIFDGLFVLSQSFPSAESWGVEDKVSLATKVNGKAVNLINIGTRLEREVKDLLYVSGDQIVVLMCSAAGGYTHHFVQKKAGKFALASGRHESGYFGSQKSVALGGSIMGVIWVSPDFNKDNGSFVYEFDENGLEFAKLPEIGGWYSIERINDEEFKLIRSFRNGEASKSKVHRFPLVIDDGKLVE